MTAPTASPAIPRVAIYARCSADKQAEKDLSIPAQLDCCRAGAKQRGWEVVAEYVDAAESATTDDRPQFREMIAAAREKPAPRSTPSPPSSPRPSAASTTCTGPSRTARSTCRSSPRASAR